MKKLYLVDVSSMFFRAFYAVRMLTNSEGMPTNAIYGFLSMSLKLLRDIKPEYMVYCFDRKEPSFRKDIDPNYKANRGEMPEDLVPQIPYIKQLTEYLGIPAMEKEKFEADDIIGTLTAMGLKNKLEVVIVSGDKDFAQLINDKVSMFDTMRDKRYDHQGVIDKWGVTPEQFIDYLAICGDSSDNIPGVKGIGPKGAEKLLAQFGDLDSIYAGLDQIKSKSQVTKLADSKDNAYLSKKLVTIVQDIDLGVGLPDLALKPLVKDKLSDVLDELDFDSFKKNLLGITAATSTTSDSEAKKSSKTSSKSKIKLKEKSLSTKELDKWLEIGEEVFVWLDPRLICICKDKEVVTITDDLDSAIKIFEKKKLRWKGFDLKKIWREWGISTGTALWDHKIGAYLIKPGVIKSFSDIYQLYCGGQLSEFPEAVEIMSAQFELWDVIKDKLKEQKMLPILQTLDLPLIEVLNAIESIGIQLNSEFLQKESQLLQDDIAELTKQIHHEAGEEFNIASPKQLGAILFEKMGLPKGKKTKTGYSTSEDVLKKLIDDFPITQKVLDFRELSKLKSTYVDALPQLVNEKTGRVHTDFDQALTATGRLSSSNPNLQNIPIRTERGRRIRQAFVAKKDHLLLSADYSQIELRVLAHITKDQGLIQAFNEDKDIHGWTASEIFSIDQADVDSDHRRKAKAVNFGIAYGQGVYGLAETLRISRGEAKEIIDNYFKKFPGVRDYMSSVVMKAKDQGYVETLFGRRRYLPELFAKNAAQRAFGERAAINAPMQGTASDLVKMAMLEIYDEYSKEMLLQVHDELLFEIHKDNLEESSENIKSIMENCVSLEVPLKVNVSFGENWAQAH